MVSILVDEDSLGHGLADYLRGLGYRVVDVYQANMNGQSDQVVIDYAITHGLTIITHNKIDFDSPNVYQRCGGVIAVESMSPRKMKQRLKWLLKNKDEAEIRHKLTLLSRNAIVSR